MKRTVGLVILFAFVAAGSTAAGAMGGPEPRPQAGAVTAAKPLTPEMTLKRWSIGDLQLSPDGRLLALVVSEPAKPAGQRRNIWLYEFSTRSLKPFTLSVKTDTHPRWSPDGHTLAFLSNRDGENQIYLIAVDGGEARPLTESKTGISGFEWAPNGKTIALETTAPKSEEEEKKEKDKDDARIVGKPEGRTLLQVVDVGSKEIKTLLKGAWRISEFVWTPGSGSLVITATDNPMEEIFSEKIYNIDVAGGTMGLLASPAGPFGGLKVSPDGKTLAYIGSRGDGPDPHDIAVMPLAGGETRNLTAKSIDRPVETIVWESAGSILASAQTGFGRSLYVVTLDGKAAKSEWTPALPFGSWVKGKSGLACVAESSTRAPELWVAAAAGQAEQVSHFNKDWDEIELVAPEIVRYPSFDKKPIEAALYRPKDVSAAGAKPPAVVLVHGGPTGAWTDRFDAWAQLLAGHGFVVLSPNVRGSTGYGHDFMVANRYDWGGGDFKDVMAGADWLVQKGMADPGRIGIGGWSYGGYMAAWAVTQTTRFKASVSGAPMTDLAFEYGSESPAINIGDTWALGDPYENLKLFLARSPMTFVKQAKTPTLILCGENDLTDPVGQCYQFHRGLRRYGIETELVVYPREGHGPREEKHRIDVLNRMVAWFEKYLKK